MPRSRPFLGIVVLLPCIGTWMACGEQPGMPGEADVSPSQADGGPPTLARLKDEIFVPSCVLGRCHTTRAPTGDLPLTGRRVPVYDALVDAPSSQVPDRMRVVPYEPEASYLMEKLTEPEPTVGGRMPPYSRLTDAEIERIRTWIAAGAPR